MNANLKITTRIHNIEYRDETEVFHKPLLVCKRKLQAAYPSSIRISKVIAAYICYQMLPLYKDGTSMTNLWFTLLAYFNQVLGFHILISGLVSPVSHWVETEKLTFKSNGIKVVFHIRTGVKVWLGYILSTGENLFFLSADSEAYSLQCKLFLYI